MISICKFACSSAFDLGLIRVQNDQLRLRVISFCHAALFLLIFTAWSIGLAQQTPQILHNHVRPAVSTGQAVLVDSLPPDQRLSLSIVLPLRNHAELTSLLGRLYDPSSPDYRHFLSVEQFTQQFGPRVEDYEAVVAFAEANGFVVSGRPANRLVVPISGSVAQINSAFNVRMNLYQHPSESRTFFSPDREPSLNLSVPIAHIAGLNNFSLPQSMLKRIQGGVTLADITGSGPDGSYLGSDMRAAYYGGTTLTGNGQAVGVLEFGGYDLSDVNATFSNAGQSYSVPVNNVLLDGATGAPVGDDAEEVLDIVQAIGMAPGLSQVRVYIGQGLDDANLFNAMAAENICKQLSVSWGWYPEDSTTDDVFFQEFAAQGQSILIASGDSGAFDVAVSPYLYPSEDAYVTSVGGTHLTTNGAGGDWAAETVWNSEGYGSGGGISLDAIPIPSWQTGVATSANGGSTTLRNEPDVAMEGDFDNYLCDLGSCGGGGAGTSFAAPRWAGFIALVNQQAVEAGNAPSGGIGFINPAIYAIGAGSSYDNDFHDVTSGNNLTEGQPVWFSATTGYDLTTGWGSANGQNLIDALAGPQVPGFWIASSSGTLNVTQGASGTATVSVTDAGGFTGSVTLAVTSALPSGVTASWGTNPTTGTSVLTLTATSSALPGTTQMTITGTSGSLTETTRITLSVHGPSFSLSTSPVSLSIGLGASGTSTITVNSLYGFTGNVTLAVTSGLPSGVTASWGTNPTSGTSVLTLTASSTAAGGTANVIITGTSGALTATTNLAVTINAPGFTLFASPPSLGIGQGSSGTSYIFVNSLNGFTGNVNLAVTSPLPSGVTASWGTNPTSGTSLLTLTVSSSAIVGQYPLTISGTSGNLTATTTLALGIYAPTFTLSATSLNIGQGSSGGSYVYVSPEYGFTGSVNLSVSGLPSGVTASLAPNPTSGNSTLTLTASSSASIGVHTVTVTGTSGNLTEITTLSLGVYAPTFAVSASGVTIGQGTSTTSYVYVSPEYGFAGSVNLSVSGLPSGVTASFVPNPTTESSTLTLTASSSAIVGQSTVMVTGTSGTLSTTTTFPLAVYAPTFTLGASSVTLGQGSSGTSYIYETPEYGFAGSVNLSLSGLPTGVTASFVPNPTTGSSTLTLTASNSAAIGQYTVTLTGTSGSLTKSTTFSLGVYVPTFTLSGSGVNMGQGSSSTNYIWVSPQYGFTGSVTLAVTSGLPSGVTASFSPNPATGNSILTLTASSSAAVGQYSLTITGTSGNQSETTTVALGIYAPGFTLGAGGMSIGQGTSGTTYVEVYPQYGFTGNVNLSISGLPSGVTASVTPNPTNGNSTLTLIASSSAAIGQYNVTVTGTSGSLTSTTTVALGIYAPGFTLSSNGTNISQGSSVTSYVYVYPQYGFAGNVTLSLSGLPSGVTASLTPNPTTGTSTLTLTASSSAIIGQYNVTVTGKSGNLTVTNTFPLGVYAPSFSLFVGSYQSIIGQGTSGTDIVYAESQYGFSGSVNLSVSGLPPGVTASFSPNPTTFSSTMTLNVGSSASVGSYTLTITGIAGSATETTTVPLQVVVPNFTLYANSTNIGQGTSTTTSVFVTPQYGFTGNVNLSVSGLPSGVTASLSPNPTTGSSVVTLTASSSATLGQYNVTITGTSGTQTATTTLTLGVYAPGFTLSAYGLNIGQGSSGTTTVSMYPQYGFTGSVTLSASGLPNGVTASFAPNPTTGYSTVTLTASSSASLGQYNVTITGKSGTQTATTIVTLGVYAPTFTISSYGLNIGQGSSGSAYVYVNSQYGFTGAVTFSASGLPSGVTASFSPNPTTGNTQITLTASSSASLGQYNVTITGTSATQTATTVLTLGVYPQSFTLSTYGLNIGQGSSGTTTVYINPQYGFTGSVTLSASGLPSGVAASFAPNPTTGSSILTLTASSSVNLGQYNVTVTGTSGALTATTTLALGVFAQSFTLYDSPDVLAVNEGSSVTSTIYLTPQYGFSSNVTLAASGLPAGITATFAPNPISSGSSVLTLAASSTATPGTATVTITGTSGNLTASTPLTLTINTPAFTLSDTPGELNLLPGSSAESTIAVIPQFGFSGNVSLAATGLPSGVTASWSPNPTSGTSQLTLTTSTNAASGNTTVTITGTSGALVATTPLFLIVKGPLATTSTTLAVTAAGAPVTSVASSTVVTLTATVSAGTTALTAGQVKFCDATATYCEDIHLLGTAQLTSAGTAVLKLIPGMGSHSYKAVFVATNADQQSSSSPSALTVTASNPSTATIAQSGTPGDYALTSTVVGQGLLSPTGTVSFLDTSSGNALLGSAALGHNQTTLSWLNSQSPEVGGPSSFVATGDFNGDGIPDLAVANNNDTLTILLGNGDGTFTPAAISPLTGSAPVSIAVGDFNQDGKLDLAIVNEYSNSVTILLGNGDGTFTSAPDLPAMDYPRSVVTGDFNGDGKPDLAVSNILADTLTIFLGNGDGTFTAIPVSPPTGSSPESMAVADFNGDGIPDLAVANQGSNTLTVLLGNGDGTFTAATANPQTGNEPYSIVAADFNGDGKTDLAVANYLSNSVTVLLGKGDGTFTPAASPPVDSYSPFVAVGDFNGDGKPDLVVTNSNDGLITILLGNGDGTFEKSAISTAAGEDPWSVAVGDFNSDGVMDLAVTSESSNAVMVLTTQLTQTATATANHVSPVGNGQHLADARYAGDSHYAPSTSATTELTAGIGTPTVTVTPPSSSITTVQSFTVTVAVSGGNGNPTPTGSVTLTGGSYTSASTPLEGGSATFIIPAGSLAAGSYTLSATYSGDINYTPASGTAVIQVAITAAITSPTPATLLAGPAVTFAWTAPTGASYYELYVGSTGVGSNNLYSSGKQTVTSLAVAGLPTSGETVYVRLMTNFSGVWKDVDYTYTAVSKGTLTTPAPGATLGGPNVTFSWTPATGTEVSGYRLYLGSTGVGSNNLYSSALQTGTSFTAPVLPTNGETIYARLITSFNGALASSDSTYTADTQAELISPTPGLLPGRTVTFTWSTAVGATGYELWLGSTGVGSNNLYNSLDQRLPSITVPNLPGNGEPIYVRLLTNFDGLWTSLDYAFTAVTQAAMTSPAPSSILTGPNVTFSWTAGAGATAYELYLGSTGAGSNNLYSSGSKTVTSLTVNALPANGETIYARLLTDFNGSWGYTDYTYTADTHALITSPAQGTLLPGPNATFTWSAATGATAYELYLGSTGVGSSNLYSSGSLTGTSFTAANLPTNGETIYARVLTNFGGTWSSADSTCTAATHAVLASPAPGSTLTGTSATFTLTPATGTEATAYELYLGSTGAGSNNLYSSGQTTATSFNVKSLPSNGETIYVRVLTNFGGVWGYVDSTLTAQ
jgi:hypothetical protein